MLLVICGWSVVMAGILVYANRKWKGPAARKSEWSDTQSANRLTDEEIQLLNRYAEYSTFAVTNVLSNTSPEAISPFVLNAPSTFADIARFYPINPGVQMIDPMLERKNLSVLRLPDGPAIEGRWVTEDGRRIEAVFRLQEDELLLDWHHFVRFGDVPWSLFLSGAGPEKGEFRLLTRRRLSRMVLDRDSSRPLSVEFYAPRFGNPDDHGPASPPFDLDWNSEAATMLTAAFEQAGEGRQPFESFLPAMESDDEMIRVRVVVRRIQEEETMRFEIVEVRACHWLQHDDPGIHREPEDPE